MLHGKLQARNRFSVQAHARTAEAIVPGDGHYPAADGLSSTLIFAMVSYHADDIAVVFDPLSVALRVGPGAGRPLGRRAAQPTTGRTRPRVVGVLATRARIWVEDRPSVAG